MAKFDFFDYLNIATEGFGRVCLWLFMAIAFTLGLPFFLLGLLTRRKASA